MYEPEEQISQIVLNSAKEDFLVKEISNDIRVSNS